MRSTVSRLAVVTLAAVLVGCGGTLPTKPKAKSTGLRTMTTVPGAALPGAPQIAAGADQGHGMQLLQRVRQHLETINGFSAEILCKTQGNYKQGVKQAELRKITIGYKLIWAKPAKLKGEVFNSADPLMEGAGLVTTDGVNIVARAKGLLSFVPIKTTAREPKLNNCRNHSFADFQPSAQIKRLTGPTATWTVLQDSVAPNGQPMAFVAVDNVARLDKEITREVFGIELATLQIRSLTAFGGETKLTDYTFQKFGWNPKITSETFKM